MLFSDGVQFFLQQIKVQYPADPVKIKMQARDLSVSSVMAWWTDFFNRREIANYRHKSSIVLSDPIPGITITADQVHAATMLYLQEQESILAMWRL